MKRHTLAALLAATGLLVGGLSPLAAHAQTKTLKVVAHADVKILDPTFTTAYISRNFGYMVYDTLFAQNSKGQPMPQMVDKFSSSNNGMNWSFTLRPGLKFSDGSAVTTADVLASLARWMSRDSMGRAMTAAGAEWKAVDAQTFTLAFKQPYGLVLESLAKPSGYPAFILPERLAKTPTTSPLNEVLGSGPYVFKRDEWVPGNKVVFTKNPHHVGRSEAPDGLAGSKAPKIDRVEWLYLPDSNSAVAALRNGEVDYIEQLPPDYIAPLRADPQTKVMPAGAAQGFFVMNHLHPPFNNPKVRQAVLAAVDQEKFTAAMGHPSEMRMAYCATYFICGSPNETAAGSEPYRKPDNARAKKLLAESGYKGEKVVLLVPTDLPHLNGAALMAVQTLRNMGMNVDGQTMDWSSVSARRSKRDLPEAGGWSAFVTAGGGFDADSPITNAFLGAACGNSLPGWPCDQKLDELRTAWLQEADAAKRKAKLDAFQARAYEAVPYIPLGQYSAAMSVRTSLKGTEKLWNGVSNVWTLDK